MAMRLSRKPDKKDLRILYELDLNARISISELARRVGLSPQVTDYRVRALFNDGTIIGSMALLDTPRLGYFIFRIYMRLQNITQKKEARIVNYLKNHPLSVWVVSASGRWDIEALFTCRNPVHFSNVIKEIKADLGRHILDINLSASVVNYHFTRSYLAEIERAISKYPFVGFEPELQHIDEKDIRILEILSKDARKSNVDMGKAVGLTYNGVKNRIRKLEGNGVIAGYRIFMDLSKIGRRYYKSLITLHNIDEMVGKRMHEFCVNDPRITYLVEIMGEWDIELEAEVKNEEEFREIMLNFRSQFGQYIRDYEVLHVYKEHKMNYFPMAKEMLKQIKCSRI
ncbi:MAG: Lrp/AsnC family transcriptional regulator [Candidatus Micrarchaeota archaeon]